MDQLTGLLDGPRARGAFLLRSVFEPPFALRIEDHAPLTVVFVAEGEACLMSEGPRRQDGPVRLAPGDVAVVRGPDPYVVADDPDTAPQAVIDEAQRCTTLYGADLAETMSLGVRTWGNDPAGSTVLLTGTYRTPGELSRRLLVALPAVLHLPGSGWDSRLVPLLREEVGRSDPGQEAVLDRLLDLLLISALRAWFARPEVDAPTWYLARTDPIVGRALRLIEGDPARAWTIGELAAQIGVSRATLARRFTERVGDPPMAYLADLRLSMAADLLREDDLTLAAVARRVGYGSPFALSTAFKRARGLSPRDYRDALTG